MATQIVRVGNTLTVEIPEDLAAKASLPVGEPMEWVANGDGSITLVRPPTSDQRRKRKTLDEIIDGIPEGAVDGEYDWGPPQGVEVW